jgi:hypothetical protein
MLGMLAAVSQASAQVGPQHLSLQGNGAAGTTTLQFGFPDHRATATFDIPFSLIPHTFTLEHDGVDMFAKATQLEYFVPAGEITKWFAITEDLLTRFYEVRISYSQTSLMLSQADFSDLRQMTSDGNLRFSGMANISPQLLPVFTWTIEEEDSHETSSGALQTAMYRASTYLIHDLKSVQLPQRAAYAPPLNIGSWDFIGAEGTTPSNATLGGIALGRVFASIRDVTQLNSTELTVVPEPASLLLLVLTTAGSAVLVRSARRRARG